MITYKIKVGNGMLEFQAQTMKDIHKFSALYGKLPQVCNNCQSPDIFLDYIKTQKNYEYFKLSCKKCGASLNFGQKKEGGFFLKADEKMKIYKAENQDNPVQESESVESSEDSEIPF